MVKIDERVSQIRDDALGAALEPGRGGLVKRGDLRNSHGWRSKASVVSRCGRYR